MVPTELSLQILLLEFGVGVSKKIFVSIINFKHYLKFTGNPDHGDKVDSPYKFTFFLQTIFALPFIVTEVWLLLSYKKEFALAHAVVSLIPLIQYISNKESKDTIDVILGVNVISLGTVSFIAEKYWGIAAAVSFCLNHFFLQKENDIIDIPPEDLYNYGMCFFAYFALRSLA